MKRSRPVADFSIGEQVRLVDLPAHPGLEGQLGEIVNLVEDTGDVDIKLKINNVIKRVRYFFFRKNKFSF